MKITNTTRRRITIVDKKGQHISIDAGKMVDVNIDKAHPFLKEGWLCAKAHLIEIPASLQIDAKELKQLKERVAQLEKENRELTEVVESLKTENHDLTQEIETYANADNQPNKG